MSDLGWELRPLDDAVRARLGVPDSVSGVVVGRIVPGGPAAEKGLRPGDIVTQIGRKPVATIEQAEAALHEATAEAPVLVVVRRGDSQRFVSLGRS
jgi:serine protease Do